MLEMLAIVIPVATVGVGGYIHLWVKSNVNEANYLSIKELINQRFDDFEERYEEKSERTDQRLDRIERSMNGYLNHGSD